MEGEYIMEKANAIVKDLLKEVSISLPALRKRVNKKRKGTPSELSTGGEQHRESATSSAKDLTTEVNPPSGTFDHVQTPFTVVAANNSNPSITIASSIQPIAAMIGSSFVGRVSPSMLIVVLPSNVAAALVSSYNLANFVKLFVFLLNGVCLCRFYGARVDFEVSM